MTADHVTDDFIGFHIDTPGTYVLIATQPGIMGQLPATPVVSSPFTVSG